ncbi:hypothetical protein M569_06776 [Genlisea aurea]|uniref:Ultraviolet-B-repressible protein n=1 Tax=Genlisea aurea TaxID=192259 RepID=S8CSY7_9LAMI|nr:hypothetical protein M569_06776 [Genlisea aurea]
MSMAVPISSSAVKRTSSDALMKPMMPVRFSPKGVETCRRAAPIESSLKEKAVVGRATAAAIAVSMAIPEMAQAADSLTPSLKNFLLSIGAGGVVVGVIAGAVIAVANFDPVKRV